MQAESVLDQTIGKVEQIAAELARRVSSAALIRCYEPMAKRTTLRVGGPVDLYVEPASEADLASVVKFCSASGMPFFVLGRGSNLLVRDGGLRGMAVCLAHPCFAAVEVEGRRMHCGAGTKLKTVAVEAKRHQLSGVEFLEGIPGTVGGALRMNAGAMGKSTFDVVESVRVMDASGEVQRLEASEIKVEYRRCPLLTDRIALGAAFKCVPATREEIERRMSEFSNKRWESQPAAPSAGCMFKNPPTVPAGKLIDELGLKGTRVGGAMVSREHGNFIVNDGTATARDILELIGVLKQRARQDRGIELHTEVEIIGQD
jgi:UDP-N-acetylenolpyruvoylglucosamine reductase